MILLPKKKEAPILKRHEDQLLNRLDAVAREGTTKIEWWELYLWYGMERLSKAVWRDIISRFQEINGNEIDEIWIYENIKGITLIHGNDIKKVSDKI